MNGNTRLRLEFIVSNSHNNLTFESRVGTILACNHPQLSHQDCVFGSVYTQITAGGLFWYLIIHMMNGQTRLRLEFIVSDSHNNLTSDHGWGDNFDYYMWVFWSTEAYYSSISLPMLYYCYKYYESPDKVYIGVEYGTGLHLCFVH